MQARGALLAFVGTAAAATCPCPAPSDTADVILGAPGGVSPIHMASNPATGEVIGAPWTWIPQDGVELQSFPEEAATLRCGNYYGWECRRVENGTLIQVNCKADTCDVYAFIYHEPPRSSNTNGRLPQTLPPDWTPGSCAPSFCLRPAVPASRAGQTLQIAPTLSPTASPVANQPCCRMTAFRRQVDGQDSVSFTIDELLGTMDAYYLVLAVAPGERCSSNSRAGSREDCEATPDCANALCKWVEGEAAAEDAHPLVRGAQGLQINPTMAPTASPQAAGGRCVDNWCPRVPVPPTPAPPVCSAPLTEPECAAP